MNATLLHKQIFTPYFCLISDRYAFGSGKNSGSKVKEHLKVVCYFSGDHFKSDDYHSYCFIQKQSMWKTRTGHSRSAMPCKKPDTVELEYEVKNDVESHSPNVHCGRRAGRPVILVNFSRIWGYGQVFFRNLRCGYQTSRGVSPYIIKYSRLFPAMEVPTRLTFSLPTSTSTSPGLFMNTMI